MWVRANARRFCLQRHESLTGTSWIGARGFRCIALSTLLPMALQPSQMSSCKPDDAYLPVRLSVEPMAPGDPIVVRLQVNWWMRRPLVSDQNWAIPMVVTGTLNPYLVALSILVAAFASYTPPSISAGTWRLPEDLRVVCGLVAAAITMGGGIWSMHFVAMLAFIMPTPMSYDIGINDPFAHGGDLRNRRRLLRH